MSKIYNYKDFLNEKFFKKLFKKIKKEDKSPIDESVKEMLEFLSSNGINTWDELLNAKIKDRKIVDTLIDSYAKDMIDVKEIKFRIRLALSDIHQLREWIKELEVDEEYEKCAIILREISKK